MRTPQASFVGGFEVLIGSTRSSRCKFHGIYNLSIAGRGCRCRHHHHNIHYDEVSRPPRAALFVISGSSGVTEKTPGPRVGMARETLSRCLPCTRGPCQKRDRRSPPLRRGKHGTAIIGAPMLHLSVTSGRQILAPSTSVPSTGRDARCHDSGRPLVLGALARAACVCISPADQNGPSWTWRVVQTGVWHTGQDAFDYSRLQAVLGKVRSWSPPA